MAAIRSFYPCHKTYEDIGLLGSRAMRMLFREFVGPRNRRSAIMPIAEDHWSVAKLRHFTNREFPAPWLDDAGMLHTEPGESASIRLPCAHAEQAIRIGTGATMREKEHGS